MSNDDVRVTACSANFQPVYGRKHSQIGHTDAGFRSKIRHMKRLFPLVALTLCSYLPAAALTESEVRQCNAMAATFAPKQAEFEAKTAERDALALQAEDAGEAWENAEALRAFGAEGAAEADAAKRVHEEAVAAFEAFQYAWQSMGQQLNTDIAAFNAKCLAD